MNAAILIKSKDSSTALTILNELSEKHPFQWSIHESKLTAFKQHTNALMNDSDQDALTNCSKMMIREEWALAIKALQQSSNDSDNEKLTQQMIARCFFEQSRYDLANQIYQRLTKQTSNKPLLKSLFYQSGLCHLLQSNEEDALAAFESVTTYEHSFSQHTVHY